MKGVGLLDRDGSRTPIGFHISNDHDKNPIDAEVEDKKTYDSDDGRPEYFNNSF